MVERFSPTRWLVTLVWAWSSMLMAATAEQANIAYVWWEGEDFQKTNLPEPVNMKLPGNQNAAQQALLSGGRWLTPQGPVSDVPYFVKYEVNVPVAANYHLWVRKFWHHGPFRWRFGDGQWRVCNRLALHDHTFLELHWGAYWVMLDQVALDAGTHQFHVEMLDAKGGGAIDCFLLIAGEFTPRGKLKPGERSGIAAPGFFAWEPDADPLTDNCPIDLRHLNEKVAGEHGFVRREGEHFVRGDGQPVRFWMVQADLRNVSDHHLERWARRLAKYGVNMVRMNLGSLFDLRMQGDDTAFSRELAKLHLVVTALKRQGIYSYFGHVYWHTHNPVADHVLPGFGDKRPIAMLVFSNDFQHWYREHLRAIMAPVNPGTGVPLAQEPAVALVEIWNESGLFFWTFKPDQFPPPERNLLERDFATWLVARHGSLPAAIAAWGQGGRPEAHTPDRPEENRIGLYSAGHLGAADWAVSQRLPQRAADQLRWMLAAQFRFYADMRRRLRDELGLGQMIAGGNWKTVDNRVLGGLERHTYTATDVVLHNAYFGPEYAPDGNRRFHAVDLGDTFREFSSLKLPATPGPLFTPLIAGHPFMVTENNWERPSRYRAEWPFLVATYASMMGVDGWNFFALDTPEWQHSMSVWDLNNPTILGQFPATALMFRRGDVATPNAPAVQETVSLDQACNMLGTKTFCGGGRDLLWVARIGDRETGQPPPGQGIDPLAFCVGPVRQEFVDGPSRLTTVPLDKFIDRERRIVHSMTGELAWDFGRGVVTVDTPRAQGATGFLAAAGKIVLRDITITANHEYGTILVVSLDDRPLAESQRILVQAATRDQPHGFATEPRPDGFQRITALGGYPLNVERINLHLELKDAAGHHALVLDGNGYLTGQHASTTSRDGNLLIQLPADAIYTLILPGSP